MSLIAKVPAFESERCDPSLPVRERQELAARRLVEVLALAEALPFNPRDELDRPKHGGRKQDRPPD
jgi:hypothetical protein